MRHANVEPSTKIRKSISVGHEQSGMGAEVSSRRDCKDLTVVIGRSDRLGDRGRHFGPIAGPGSDFENGAAPCASHQPCPQASEIGAVFPYLIEFVIFRRSLAVICFNCHLCTIRPLGTVLKRNDNRTEADRGVGGYFARDFLARRLAAYSMRSVFLSKRSLRVM